jgi:hypothetical protein
VRKPSKPIPEKVSKIWAQEWAKGGEKVDWQEAHAAERLSSVAQEVGGWSSEPSLGSLRTGG